MTSQAGFTADMSKKRQIVLNPGNIARATGLLKCLIHINQNVKPNEVALSRLVVTKSLQRQQIQPLEVEKALEIFTRDQIVIPIGKNRVLFILNMVT